VGWLGGGFWGLGLIVFCCFLVWFVVFGCGVLLGRLNFVFQSCLLHRFLEQPAKD